MTAERRENSQGPERPILPEPVWEAADWLEKEIGRLMEGEDRKDALFRLAIFGTEIGDIVKYITHDPAENPRARVHGTRQEEIHAYGQVFVQIIGLMWARGISFKEALSLGLHNWQERDWQKVEVKSEGGIVEGRVANSGSITGTAYVVSKEHKLEEFKNGVLVATFVKPDHMTFFHEIRPLALITDQGGVASHPAILARELGIPAIVGTGDATIKIPHGVDVLVVAEGKIGTVTILSPNDKAV